jgi:transcriptional regulator with XRE-family HTH domain
MHQSMDLGSTLVALMQRDGISQVQVAKLAGVSQATVSRTIRRVPLRNGPARALLVKFMHTRAAEAPAAGEAVDAINEIWDGSGEHAAALATLIRASSELWPRLGEERLGGE